MLTLILLVVIAIWLVSTEKVQNILVKRASKYLSEKMHTNVEVNHIRLAFFNEYHLEGVFVQDDRKDTLAYVGDLSIKTSNLLSNYWNNESAVIHSVNLTDIYVNMNRGHDTSRWNYDFIAEAFASDSKDTSTEIQTTKTSNKSNSGPSIDLKEISIKNARFYMNDAWRGEDMRFAIQDLKLDMNHLILVKKNIDIQTLAIEGANVFIREYEGGKPEDNTPDDTTTWGTPFNPDLYQLAAHSISLKNSQFAYLVDDNIPAKKEFDEKHLNITDINLELGNTHVDADTIFSDIKSMTAKERCGIELKSVSANVKLSQVQAQLSNLLLKTNYSTVGNHYEMNYRNFHDFKEFLEKVSIKAHLEQSSVSSLDIAYFAPILNQYPISINVKGDAQGLIGNLVATNLELDTRNTQFKGSGTVVGLPDIENTIFNVNAELLKTNGADLNTLIPQTKNDAIAWNKLNSILFKGSYSGKVDEFNTKGSLTTSLGNAIVDLNMNFKPKIPSYDGHLSTQDFQLGNLIKQKSVGNVTMTGKIKGSGFDLNTLSSNVNATITKIELENTIYQNLTINGLVANKKFDGIFVSQDPNMTLNFDGKMDLSGKNPNYNFNSRFLKVNLQKLGLTKDPVIGSGFVTMNFTGNNIDNFTGIAILKNLTIERAGESYFLKDLTLESHDSSHYKSLRLSSTLADANLNGKFNISELANSFQLYLYHYLPDYISKPKKFTDEQFTFDVTLKNPDTLLSMFSNDFHHLANISLSGILNTQTQKFSLDANVPNFGYKDFLVNNLFIVGAGDFTSFDLNANGGNVSYNNDVIIPSFQLNSTMAHDTAMLNINSQSINEVLGEASLNCKATAYQNNLYVNVMPSNFSLKNDKWQLYSNHDMVFGDRIRIKDFIIESGAQKITINTLDNETNDIVAKIDLLDLEGASTYLSMEDVKIHGRINGEVKYIDYKNTPSIEATISSADQIIIVNDTLGLVKADIKYDIEKQKLIINKNTTIIKGNNEAGISGNINVKDSTIDLIAKVDNMDISPVGHFIADYISDLHGFATGQVNIDGRLSNPTITGRVDLDQARLKVLFLGTSYSLSNAKFKFNNETIEMNDIILKDQRAGEYTGVLKGKITHNNFSDFYLNFTVNSPNFLCLNTRSYDNDLFYGYVPAQVKLKLNGPLDDIVVDVDAKPLKGSQFHMPINSKGDASKYEYVQFASIGRSQEEERKKKSYYLNLNMNIDATPDAEVFIILDQNTGEEIRAKGNGAIKLNVDLGNSISMYGAYVITEGKYLFNFRGLIPRDFAIEENSKITWSGDALDALLDVNAIYKLPKQLPLYPLISAQYNNLDEVDKSESKRAYSTYISLRLKGSLSQPNIKFDITQPDNKAIGTAGYTKLEQIKNDEKELVSQSGILLLLGEFKASDGITNSSYRSGSISTVSDMVSSALSSEVTNLFQKLTGLKNINLNVGYQSYEADYNTSLVNRNEFSVNVQANLLKDRVIVDLGNSVDVGKDVSGKTTGNLIGGDFKAQFLISEDGRFRATAYRTNNTNNLDLGGQNFTKGGVGLTYRKVFNSFSDLFTSKKKRNSKIILTDSLKNES